MDPNDVVFVLQCFILIGQTGAELKLSSLLLHPYFTQNEGLEKE